MSRTEPAAPSRSTPRDKADDQQQNYRAGKGDDHLADDRVAGHLHLDVEKRGKEATKKGAEYAHDHVAEETEPMTERNTTGQEARHQPDDAPNQDRAPVEVDRGPVDGYDHFIEAPSAEQRMSSRP